MVQNQNELYEIEPRPVLFAQSAEWRSVVPGPVDLRIAELEGADKFATADDEGNRLQHFYRALTVTRSGSYHGCGCAASRSGLA